MRRSRTFARLALLTAVVVAAGASPAAAGGGGGDRAGTYRNPVSASFADTFADPSVIRGLDGYWYSYGTSDPLREGEGTFHRIPIARSSDLVTWTYLGDAFSNATLPSWADPRASIWAPDIRYVDGQYRMYYVVTETTTAGTAPGEPNDNAVGMATAPTPAGPWVDSGAPVVGPRRGPGGAPGNFLWSFDPTAVTDTDGSQWLFYGSYYGGIYVTELARDGRSATGTATMVAIDNKFEGAYPVRRGGYWYLFASTANCCAGPTTGYSVQVGRSTSLRGPYLDRDGNAMTESRAGGTPVLTQNGNRWIGAGHNAVVTDLAGQDWIAYHAIDRADPYLDGTDGINERPMLLDRLDWIDGWPAVNAGAGPSDTPVRAPVTSGLSRFDGGIGPELRQLGTWSTGTGPQTGAYALSGGPGALVSRTAQQGRVRVEADLRSDGASYGLTAGGTGRTHVVGTVEPASRSVVLREYRGSRVVGTSRAALPTAFRPADWHALSLDVQGGLARLQLTYARLFDPLAEVSLDLRGTPSGPTSVVAAAAGVGVDNVSSNRAAKPVTRLVRDRVPDRLDAAASEEFSGSAPGPAFTWVRQDTRTVVTGGALRWPTQAADLVGTGNDAGLLLTDPGDGPWTVETRVKIDLGTDTVRNFQQAGLVAYVNDDLFTRLSHVAIFNTRQTEFGFETPYAGRLSYGGTIVGAPAETTDLRITHRVDPANGEHELRAWSRQPGRDWVKGGVWTLPAGSDVRVGLVSHGGAGATADFDYVRLYR